MYIRSRLDEWKTRCMARDRSDQTAIMKLVSKLDKPNILIHCGWIRADRYEIQNEKLKKTGSRSGPIRTGLCRPPLLNSAITT